MNDLYGYSLFTKDDIASAFNYITHDTDSPFIMSFDMNKFNEIRSEDYRINNIIIMANMKKVSEVTYDNIIPDLISCLSARSEKAGIITFNPDLIVASANPFMDTVATRLLPYIISEMFASKSLWLYFDGFINKELEQVIKLKYHKYISYKHDKLYLKILPADNFGLIYDLIDDIYSVC